MSRPLPRFHADAEKAEWARKLAKILLETGAAMPDTKTVTHADHWDKARLRGLPAIGRGVSGAIPGTDPLRYVISRESGRRRQR